MTARSIDWSSVLTELCLTLLLAHFLLIIGAGQVFPEDWLPVASLIAVGLACLAIILFLGVIWLDYRSGGRSRWPEEPS